RLGSMNRLYTPAGAPALAVAGLLNETRRHRCELHRATRRGACATVATMHPWELDATACAELVRSGDATPSELVELAIARIEKHNPELGAVIVPLYERARSDAAEVADGPFRGVPILIKDICATVGGALHTSGLLPL